MEMLEVSLLFNIVDVVKRCTFKNDGPVTTLKTFQVLIMQTFLMIVELLMNNVISFLLHKETASQLQASRWFVQDYNPNFKLLIVNWVPA